MYIKFLNNNNDVVATKECIATRQRITKSTTSNRWIWSLICDMPGTLAELTEFINDVAAFEINGTRYDVQQFNVAISSIGNTNRVTLSISKEL